MTPPERLGRGNAMTIVSAVAGGVKREAAASPSAALLRGRSDLKEPSGILAGEARGGAHDLFGNPTGKRGGMDLVPAGGSMNLLDCRKASGIELLRQPYQRRPQPPMNVRYFAADQTTHQDIGRLMDGARAQEDVVSLGMRPPTTANRPAGDGLSQTGNGPAPRFENHAVGSYKG